MQFSKSIRRSSVSHLLSIIYKDQILIDMWNQYDIIKILKKGGSHARKTSLFASRRPDVFGAHRGSRCHRFCTDQLISGAGHYRRSCRDVCALRGSDLLQGSADCEPQRRPGAAALRNVRGHAAQSRTTLGKSLHHQTPNIAARAKFRDLEAKSERP